MAADLRRAPFDEDSSDSSASDGEELVNVNNRRTSRSSKRTYGLIAGDIDSMVRGRKKMLLDENLYILRSITNSRATGKTSIILDAFKYIEDLKQRVRQLNRDLVGEVEAYQRQFDSTSQPDAPKCEKTAAPMPPTVTVVAEEKGLQIHVCCEKWPGLLVRILEAIEELGLNVLQARVSCRDFFLFEALSGEDPKGRSVETHVVKTTLLQTIETMDPDKGCAPHDA